MTSEQTSEETSGATPRTGPTAPSGPATFRPVPLPALVAVGFVALGLSPIAFQGGAWFLVFLVPLVLAFWLLRTRTVVDDEALRVLLAWGTRRVGWDEVATLRVVDRGWVRAVRRDEDEVALVGVRTRDLGRIAAASGGRIDMPTPEEVADARDRERELEATRLRIARLRERQAEEGAGQGAGQSADPDPAEAPEERA
ncbi:PH domain-containing protein [Actinomycetospora straminea]|uniref:Low molecular weight protein antigen 6 PH domain-containing protein n=1 Tax=Actinomycetospora straminea TaxID=663607 RepID=A0ABP9EU23_9PSEU|nr:PH domain-containing protein [Actinomycetospora straminea]MDD7933541.1 PH domain-containing protein [Actinomycetospora straminea]